jgi:hypothetical protein
VDLKYSMVDHQSSQTKFPCLPGRFLGEFPNPAVCEEKNGGVQLIILFVGGSQVFEDQLWILIIRW